MMMPHVPTFSGANPDVFNYGSAYHGFLRTLTRLDSGASASVTLNLLRDTSRGVVRPVLTITGDSSGTAPDPGTYDPLSPAHGLFFCVPYTQVGSGPSPPTYTSVLRARFRSASATNPNISYYTTPDNKWTDVADGLSWSCYTTNFVGTAGVLLDLAFSGNTSNYQTYLIQNTFTA